VILALVDSLWRYGRRSLRSGGLPLFFSVMMSALGLFAVTALGTVVWNFRDFAHTVSTSVAAVAFLDDAKVQNAAAAEEVRARLQLLPGVERAVLMTPDEALARARRGLPHDAGLDVAGLTMPWIVEVTPRVEPDVGTDMSADVATPGGADVRGALAVAIRGVDGVADVAWPGGELARIDTLLRLLHGAGAFLTLLIALVVVVVSSNAVRLTVLVRKDEIAIQQLVGASDAFIAAPLLLSGVVQGAGGGVLALLAMALTHTSLARVLGGALSGPLGSFSVAPLPPSLWLLVVMAGGALGALGAALSVWRHLRGRD
jgi:cell division transport system permease protein